MKLIVSYQDPGKRWLQRIEVATLLVVFPLALVLGARSSKLWFQFRQAEPLYVQGELLLHSDKPQQAIPLLESALKLYPEFLPAWHTLGLSYHMAGDHEKELGSYRRAVSVVADDHALHRDLATAFHENNDHKSELKHLEIAATLPMADESFQASLLRRARAEAAGTYPITDDEKTSRGSDLGVSPHVHVDGDHDHDHDHDHADEGSVSGVKR